MGVTNCYYISTSGSDSNDGASEASGHPWAHLPGMATWVGSHTPTAADGFILKGCDVWTNGNFPIMWSWSGTSGNPVAITVDETWYNTTNCPSAWNRPVWDAQKTVISSNNYFIAPSAGYPDTNYVTLDNIEMVHLEFTASSEGSAIGVIGATSQGWTISNNYIHAWDASADNCVLIQGTYEATTSQNDVYEYNVIDGSDATGVAINNSSGTGVCYAFYTDYNGVKITNNVIRYVVNPFVGYNGANGTEIGGNLIEYILSSYQGASHCNGIESLGGSTFWIHDNVIRNFECGGAESMWVGDTANEVDYVWNNVLYGLDYANGSAQVPNAGENVSGIKVYFWNNTVVAGASDSSPCLAVASGRNPTSMTVYGQNNHCVTEGSNAIDPNFANHGTLVSSYNLAMSHSTATTDGYTASQTYAYSPTSASSPTVGQGTNLASSWPSGFSTNDTQYGCSYNQSAHTVTCPARTTNPRPTSGSGNWDIGAYQDPPSTSLLPPSNVEATAH
jgi:hypothetical protein